MSKYLSVEEYAAILNISDSAVRKQIRSGKLPAIKDKSSKRPKYLIAVTEEEFNKAKTLKVSEPRPEHHTEPEPEKIEEAELVAEPVPEYSLVSMENATFERLLDDIKTLANDRKEADQHYITRLEEELYKVQAELKTVKEELQTEKIKAAQFEADNKIKELRIQELEKKTKWFRRDLF